MCFSHRSFQEFLVAEHLTGTEALSISHEKRSETIDEAVSQFILYGQNPKVIDTWFESLPGNGKRLSSTYINLFCSRKEIYKILERRIADDVRYQDQISVITVEEVGILGNLALSKMLSSPSRLKVVQFLRRLLVTGDKPTAALAFHYILRIKKTKKDWINILEQVLQERIKFQEKVARKNDRVAHRIVLGDDAILKKIVCDI
ncbi:hypothetical protein [Undibacterium curvum]|uniref:Uncharacterized protein n=1 Tax=Undibacterium curvum TaxID=2762294 RepID=A0ABR7A7V7_9BURK|nr:hypothetical protein [Undibacterium curvum]MBC3932990.1 hypothetical protein [Undibacterium curvum]